MAAVTFAARELEGQGPSGQPRVFSVRRSFSRPSDFGPGAAGSWGRQTQQVPGPDVWIRTLAGLDDPTDAETTGLVDLIAEGFAQQSQIRVQQPPGVA